MFEAETRRRRQTAILTHNFLSWPCQVVLSSSPHLALLLFLGRGYSTGGPLWHTLCYLQSFTFSITTQRTQQVPVRWPLDPLAVTVLSLPTWLTVEIWHWATTSRLELLRGHLHISFHNTHDFCLTRECFRLFLQVRPVQRISDWRLGQEPICNINCHYCFLRVYHNGNI